MCSRVTVVGYVCAIHYQYILALQHCVYCVCVSFATESISPGANRYSVKEGLTRKGVARGPAHSMKGRPSPFVYNGFSNNAMCKCSTLV